MFEKVSTRLCSRVFGIACCLSNVASYETRLFFLGGTLCTRAGRRANPQTTTLIHSPFTFLCPPQVVVIDGKGHLLGRLAATVAKELLKGQRIVIVRAEEINISGTLGRNYMLWEHYLNKRMNTNPRRGPFHYKAPARIFWRTVRGMIPHKTVHGAQALDRLKAFEGIPAPYDKVKRVVAPGALTVIRLKPGRKFCRVGDLSKRLGWKWAELVEKLEKKRLTRDAAWAKTQAQIKKIKATAVSKDEKLAPLNAKLAEYGF